MEPLEILTSPVIPQEGFVHGFPTRRGGVSVGRRASLNLGYRWGDDPENVHENRRRVALAAGFDVAHLQVTKHVHGTNVWVAGDELLEGAEFDGMVSTRPGDTLGAFAADCIPIVFADPVARAVATAHAGHVREPGDRLFQPLVGGSRPLPGHLSGGPRLRIRRIQPGP